MSSVINTIKDGYLKAVNWIDDNPNKTLMFGAAYVFVSLVLMVL